MYIYIKRKAVRSAKHFGQIYYRPVKQLASFPLHPFTLHIFRISKKDPSTNGKTTDPHAEYAHF